MKKDTERTTVIFRKFRQGDIIALFPEIQADQSRGNCQSYQHTGQHSAASYRLVDDTKLAIPEEFMPLADELYSIGYKLNTRKRISKKWFE